ncbi:hypothetical protein [Streptomyces nanshensis]|uniref:Uncharacterized protein n=1 Tax=Streptomyces nanshensis TaxID=518642 RepID=A0A1E7L3W6_9ACTN|nr:hypothetical protein [Streptomyces nanshensis]OEV10838.1 hypothetical protein AN218_15685 [Streptomyces nanshensis]
MPLHALSAPAPASRSVLAALRSPAAAHRGRRPHGTSGADGPSLEIELPLPVHELTGSGLPYGASAGPSAAAATAATVTTAASPAAPATSVSRTRLTGWRFLLRAAGAPAGSPAVGAAETLLTPDGWAFAYFCGGPYVASAQRALKQAESLPGVHQPRLLSVPRLYMLTLWLHADTAADVAEGAPRPSDVLIPLSPAPPGIAAHVPRRADALLPVLTRRSGASAPLLSGGR